MSLNLDDLGFAQPPKDTRIVVAMSGGVDSSVTAALLHEAGFQVIGVTLQLYDQGALAKKKGACCAGQDIYDAKSVADKLGFAHYVLDYESIFKQAVVDDFADSYLRGETPLPCVRCNQKVKFRDLFKVAQDLGGDALATGHYVQRHMNAATGMPELFRGGDPKKDQSYFMFTLSQQQLKFLRFPLGGLSKDVTRHHAARFGLSVADKPDSQDICFVPNGNYAELLKKMRPESTQPGKIVTQEGRVVGHHQGVVGYTIGQRKGLAIGAQSTDEKPWYVIALRPETCEVVVGPKEALATTRIQIKELNWLGAPLVPGVPQAVSVKIRSTTEPIPASIMVMNAEGTLADVTLGMPEYGVSPGQACVAYAGDQVLGGGWIMRPTDPTPTDQTETSES